MTQTVEEREIAERARIQEQAGRLFGLVMPKRFESERWLYEGIRKEMVHWVELEDDRNYELLASCVLHSGRVRENMTTPYLFCYGPPGTGKNRIGHLMRVLCCRGFLVGNPSSASIFTAMDTFHPSLIIDEGEKLAPFRKNPSDSAQAILEILNSGYAQNQFVPRAQKETGVLKLYDPYGFKVILSTETLPYTLLRRCAIITTDENVNKDIPVSHPTWEDLCDQRSYLEWYWGTHDPRSPQYKPPDRGLSFEDLKLLIPHPVVEIYGPLFRVTPEPKAQAHILELAKEAGDDKKQERGTGEDAEILQALARLRQQDLEDLARARLEKPVTPMNDRYRTADIAGVYNEGREKWETLTSDSVGRKLGKFGLKPCRINWSRGILWNEARLLRRFKRYGIEPPQLRTVSKVDSSGEVASHIATSALSQQREGDQMDERFENPDLLHPDVPRTGSDSEEAN